MKSVSPVAIDRPATRAGLRRRWRWAFAETAAGAALLAPLVVWGVESSDLAPFALMAGVLILAVGVAGSMASALIGWAVHRHPWTPLSGRHTFRYSEAQVVVGTTPGGSRILFGVWSANPWRFASIFKAPPDQVWVAVGDRGLGAAAPVPGDRLALVIRWREGSRQERHLREQEAMRP